MSLKKNLKLYLTPSRTDVFVWSSYTWCLHNVSMTFDSSFESTNLSKHLPLI